VRRRRALREIGLASAGACLAARGRSARAEGPAHPEAGRPSLALQRSDVVFMYEAAPEVYAAYGATLLAWGGAPTAERRRAAVGVAWHGSVGMVTEFAAYHRRFPRTWEEGLCRDVHGQPLKVPWLTDQQHEGVPYWWCCTRQPQFRQFLEERVAEIVRAGADGVHVDDHLGSSGALFLGACFCGRCVAGFREHAWFSTSTGPGPSCASPWPDRGPPSQGPTRSAAIATGCRLASSAPARARIASAQPGCRVVSGGTRRVRSGRRRSARAQSGRSRPLASTATASNAGPSL
jgi:hypothetical protein